MKNLPVLILAAALLIAGCKKNDAPVTEETTPTGITPQNIAATAFVSTPANALQGVNWACTADNFCDTILVLSGLSSTDSYSTVSAKTNSILTSLQSNTGANTIRIPINYATTSQVWWNSYAGIIDAATAKGMNVIIGCWEGKSSEDGLIDNTTQFWSMWQTVVNKYVNNSHVYFEVFNEPHGYTLTNWANVCAQWLSTYSNVPQGRILIDGTSYSQDVTGVGADSRFTNCLLSIHDYTFFTSAAMPTAYSWETRLAANVGSYGNRTVMTEFGDTMNSGKNFTGAIGGDKDIAYIQGFTNQVRSSGMGSVYWPGIRTGDSYSMETIVGSGTNLTLTNTNASGLSRLKYGWGVGTGGTDVFYPTAYYRFLNLNSGLAMDVNGGSTANGANIIQWPQNGGNNQQWIVTDNGGGYYKIINRNSGLALDVNAGSTANGAGIIQWPWNGGNNQQWQITAVTTGIFKAINRNSSLALDVNGASKVNGAGIIQWPWSGANNQQWTIVQQ
jgi:endoglucanase